MIGLAEIIIKVLDKALPDSLGFLLLDQSLPSRVISAAALGLGEIPRTATTVYCFTGAAARFFPQARHIPSGERREAAIVSYSLLTTCLNEAKQIEVLLDSILRQSVLPHEVIICDAGSSDGTTQIIEQWGEKNLRRPEGGEAFSLKIIAAPGVNIAAGRNRAAWEAQCEYLLFTDAGATLDRFWAERLLYPFSQEQELEVSMGYYQAVCSRPLQASLAFFLLPRLEAINPETFLPSGRSLALKKEVFKRVGGYPEFLTFAGEDSLFDYYLKTVISRAAFVPDALAFWFVPQTPLKMWRTVANYACGDAEAGLFYGYYLTLLPGVLKIFLELGLFLFFLAVYLNLPWSVLGLLVLLLGASVLWRGVQLLRGYSPWSDRAAKMQPWAQLAALLLMLAGQTVGFIRGLRRRELVEQRRLSEVRAGYAVLLTEFPLRYAAADPASALVSSYLNNGWHFTVVFARELPPEPIVSQPEMAHPRLAQFLRREFDLAGWYQQHRGAIGGAGKQFIYRDALGDAISRDLGTALRGLGAGEL